MRALRTVGWSIVVAMALMLEAYAKEIERSDYKITVPDKCTEDPQEPDIDLDHMTTINLPDENTMIVMVLDDKAALDKSFENLKSAYKGKLKNPQEKNSAIAGKRKGKGFVLTGLLNGMKFCFEVGAFSGKQKGFIIISTYLESEQAKARGVIQKAVDSFVIKE